MLNNSHHISRFPLYFPFLRCPVRIPLSTVTPAGPPAPAAPADGSTPQCIRERLYTFEAELGRLDSVVSHVPPLPADHQHVPYVGNGHVALVARPDSPLYVRHLRTLNVSVPFLAVVSARLDGSAAPPQEAVLIQYAGGVVQRLQCYPMDDRSLDTTYKVCTYCHGRPIHIVVITAQCVLWGRQIAEER